ncbi:hypothetical protein LEN26_019622 [Aphanomyces euteiches]|nr:hypothetical protein LEN26_019622 [Aphanomyces euteiches]KAH9108814.1 hypothetical protein AeMF1_016029 [Aphanomyces euteiches]KAH9195797.1 hypothetical protein AeNC1_002219 [Aphanomyces euteiches]
MGLNDPPLDVALIEKQLALLSHLGVLTNSLNVVRSQQRSILRDTAAFEQLASVNPGRYSNKKREANEKPMDLEVPSEPHALPTHRHEKPSKRRNVFRQWQYYTLECQQTRKAEHAHNARLIKAMMKRWRRETEKARECALNQLWLQSNIIHRRLHAWHKPADLKRRLRLWQTKIRVRLYIRLLKHHVLNSFRLCFDDIFYVEHFTSSTYMHGYPRKNASVALCYFPIGFHIFKDGWKCDLLPLKEATYSVIVEFMLLFNFGKPKLLSPATQSIN